MSKYQDSIRERRQRDERMAAYIDLIVCSLALPILPVAYLLIARAFLGI